MLSVADPDRPLETATPALPPFDARACFVAGQAKSGTTLLVALLDGHPALLALPEETAYFPTVLRKYGRRSRREQFDYLTRESLARVLFGGEPKWRQQRAPDYTAFPRREFLNRFETLAFHPDNARRDLLALLLEAYAEMLGRPLDSVRWWVEKTPANRDHLPAIRQRFPAAKTLLTLRDPRAVFASRIALERTRRTRRFSAYLCAAHWLATARLALEANASPGSGLAPLLVVPYEQLVAAPADSLARVWAFLGVPAADPPPVPTKAGRPWPGNSASAAAFDAVSTEPVARWRHYLTREELGWIEFHCRDLMPPLGYEPLLAGRDLRHWFRAARGETPREYLKSRWRSLRDRFYASNS